MRRAGLFPGMSRIIWQYCRFVTFAALRPLGFGFGSFLKLVICHDRQNQSENRRWNDQKEKQSGWAVNIKAIDWISQHPADLWRGEHHSRDSSPRSRI
jgi:hypothetical protein